MNIVAQTAWQQGVKYEISVELDDQRHQLKGYEKILYTNNSPQAIPFIYMHLYPNAYKDRSSALSKELIERGSTDLYFAAEKDRGYIDSLDFKEGDQKIRWTYLEGNKDIALLYLNKPLQTGDSIWIETPFFVQIPGNFSRLSHVGQSYQICQWYPKPAVYDTKGWHPMPYHDQGEFFSEFASYKVQITLAKNYIVGATGILQEKQEQAFMDSLAMDSSYSDQQHIQFPASAKEMKTITFVQDKVHDFAWFADKRFIVRKSSVVLPNSKRVVKTYALFTGYYSDLWEHACDYINRSLSFYSSKLGDYPYAMYTAIDGTLSAGGGMEYPMITNINSPSELHELDIVITHEVGHSWFYGVLASNERDEPWLDEGINSYYESLYNDSYYPNEKLYRELIGQKWVATLLGVEALPDSYRNKLFYLYSASKHSDQPINLKSRQYSYQNYGSVVYSKTALAIDYLADYMGKTSFEFAMKSYYENFQFKHPTATDFQNELQKISKNDLQEMFNHLINTNQYQHTHIRKIKAIDGDSLQICLNKKAAEMPFPISCSSAYAKTTNWYQKSRITIPESDIKVIQLMANSNNINTPFNIEQYQMKNNRFVKSLRKLQVKAIGIVRAPNQRQLNILPIVGWNQSDKFMLGVLFYSSIIPSPKLEYQLAPMFATGSLRPSGMGRITLHCYPQKLQELRMSMKVQSFSYSDYYIESINKTKHLAFFNAQPSIKIIFKNKKIESQVEKSLLLQSSIVFQEFKSDFTPSQKVGHLFQTTELKFNFLQNKKINPYSIVSSLQFSSDFASLNTTLKYSISYYKAKCAIDFRLFAGVFLFKNKIVIDNQKGFLPPNRSLTMSANPLVGNIVGKMNEDFTYESIYLDRAGETKVLSHQVFHNKEGGFRSMIGTGLGNSDQWILSLQASASLPKRIPLRPFACIGTGYLYNYNKNSYTHGVFIAEAGFSIIALKDIFEIHFPLLVTKNIRTNQNFNFGIDKFYERITFTLDLNLLNPFEKIRNLKY